MDDEQWQAVPGATPASKCGQCGVGFVVYYRDRLGCFGTRARHVHEQAAISREEVEERVLTALQEKLLRKDFFEDFCREFAKEMNRLRMEQRRASAGRCASSSAYGVKSKRSSTRGSR